MACPDKCCTVRLSDMRPTDIEPASVDASEWLESVGSSQLTGATWTVTQVDGQTPTTPLVAFDPQVSRGDNTAIATLTGGDPGQMYKVEVQLTSCEGYRTTVCFMQYILDCN